MAIPKKVLFLPLFAIIFAACNAPFSTSNVPPKTAATLAPNSITLRNFVITPSTLVVSPGTTITITNNDDATHDLVADNGSFDTGSIAANGTGTFTAPSTPGSYPFHCSIHPKMTAVLVVQ